MNKKLFEKVKAKCKDTGLSEKCLQGITETLGGTIADDSTDEAAIETAANQIQKFATETVQSETTRWANAKKDPKEPKDPKDPDDPSKKDQNPKEPKKDPEDKPDPYAEKIAAMEKEITEMKAEKAKGDRNATIQAAIKKHGIPEWRTKGLSVPDDADPDTFMADIKQDLITNNLMPQSTEGAKASTEAGTDEAAKDLLAKITVKD